MSEDDNNNVVVDGNTIPQQVVLVVDAFIAGVFTGASNAIKNPNTIPFQILTNLFPPSLGFSLGR